MCTPELLGSYPNLSNYLDLCKSSFKGATKDEEGIQALQDLLEKSLTGKWKVMIVNVGLSFVLILVMN